MSETSNNALQRNVIWRGHPVLAIDCALAGVEWASWPAAQHSPVRRRIMAGRSTDTLAGIEWPTVLELPHG